ncbi:MAG: carboxypeptidase regulatory-like domain-containing protein [Vicinamibacterales bacterium]
MKRLLGLVMAALTLWCAPAMAQDGSLLGTVTDDTKAVLPGATVTATSLATGRTLTALTNERGEYRIPGVPAGLYRIQAELSGFSTVVVPELELLVGQNRTVPFTLTVAALQESVTVTGEAPLVDTRSAAVAGNVDRRQMEELPLQGRNWMELSMMVKGITANHVDNQPGVRDRQFQLNLDGQEITQQVAGSGFGQPKFSREAIAEFQVITNLFDITMGRSQGIQVQAISRSGTNDLAGTVYGYFRDDRFNAKDFIAGRVLPYSNQQVGAAVGGPLVRDKVHYFLSYEYEREPNTILTSPPAFPGQSFSFDTKLTQTSFLGRGDYQVGGHNHLTVRGSYWDWKNPFTQVSGTEHPSQAANRSRKAVNLAGSWSRVITQNVLQEVKVGYSHFDWKNLLAEPALAGSPNLVFPGGVNIGQRRNYPQEFFQNTYSFRYDLSLHRGSHDWKIGGEFLRWHDTGQWQLLSRGEFIFTSTPPDLTTRIPASAWNDPTRWNLSGLDNRVLRYDQNFGDWTIDIPRPTYGIWIGDTWALGSRLTLNYGVRYDLDWGAIAPPHVTTQVTFDPRGGMQYADIALNAGDRLYRTDMRDTNNIAPRAGFTWNVTGNSNFVIRGGSGLYYSINDSNTTFSQQSFNGERIIVNSFANDGLPGFIRDPTRGRTADDFLSGRFPLPAQGPRVIAHDYQMPKTWQSVVGFQRELGEAMAVDADLSYWRAYNQGRQRDPNLFFDAVTGYNRNPATAGRPDPKFGQIQWLASSGKANFAALATSVTRRYRNNFQANVAYTLTLFMNDNTTNFQFQGNNPFRPDDEWARSTEFQRHTLRLNGIYRLPWDISLAGAYLFGSGQHFLTNVALNPYGHTGTTRLNSGTAPIVIPDTVPTSPADPAPIPVRDRFNGPSTIAPGEIAPRNALRGLPLHKVDLRFTKDLRLPGGMKLTGIAEVFNLFNHANYGAYNGQINSTTFGQPRQNALNAYLPRVWQFACKVGF